MKITSITYGKTVNIGNYQSIRLDYSADCEELSPNETLKMLKLILSTEESTILRENPPTRK